jgi:hypothetical protein
MSPEIKTFIDVVIVAALLQRLLSERGSVHRRPP